ncbi:MAG: DUF3891 family protein [Pelobium sp.]
MFVRYTQKGWKIILQRNHALLAAQICARWKIGNQPSRWVETLIACADHDDSSNELEDTKLLTDAGGPMDFGMGEFDEAKTRLLINMAITKSAFTALLVSKHFIFTHGNEPKAKKILSELEPKESEWIRVAETSKKEVEEAYRLLEFCDAFSILICQDAIQPEKRSMEISMGPDGKMYEVLEDDECLVVKPWPFEVDEFELNYEVREIGKINFKNDEQFRKILYETLPQQRYVKLKK